jgi:hypothetical protein
VLDLLIRQTIAQGSKGRGGSSFRVSQVTRQIEFHEKVTWAISRCTRTCQYLPGINVIEKGWQMTVQLTSETVRELKFLADRLVELNGQHMFSLEARTKIF